MRSGIHTSCWEQRTADLGHDFSLLLKARARLWLDIYLHALLYTVDLQRAHSLRERMDLKVKRRRSPLTLLIDHIKHTLLQLCLQQTISLKQAASLKRSFYISVLPPLDGCRDKERFRAFCQDCAHVCFTCSEFHAEWFIVESTSLKDMHLIRNHVKNKQWCLCTVYFIGPPWAKSPVLHNLALVLT